MTDPAFEPQAPPPRAVPSRRRELALTDLPALAEARAELARLDDLVRARRQAAQAADADERVAAIRALSRARYEPRARS